MAVIVAVAVAVAVVVAVLVVVAVVVAVWEQCHTEQYCFVGGYVN